jgi:hypothetical protein
VAINANRENARSRMEASSAQKHEYGAKEDESSTGHVRAAGFHHVTALSRFAGVLKRMNRLFLQFSNFFSGRGEPRVTKTTDTESVDTGARLYCMCIFCMIPTTYFLALTDWPFVNEMPCFL